MAHRSEQVAARDALADLGVVAPVHRPVLVQATDVLRSRGVANGREGEGGGDGWGWSGVDIDRR